MDQIQYEDCEIIAVKTNGSNLPDCNLNDEISILVTEKHSMNYVSSKILDNIDENDDIQVIDFNETKITKDIHNIVLDTCNLPKQENSISETKVNHGLLKELNSKVGDLEDNTSQNLPLKNNNTELDLIQKNSDKINNEDMVVDILENNDDFVPTIVDIRGACSDVMNEANNCEIHENAVPSKSELSLLNIVDVQGGISGGSNTSNNDRIVETKSSLNISELTVNNMEQESTNHNVTSLNNVKQINSEIKESEVHIIESTSKIPLPIPIKTEPNVENEQVKPDKSYVSKSVATKSTHPKNNDCITVLSSSEKEDNSVSNDRTKTSKINPSLFASVGYSCHLCHTSFQEYEILNEHMKLHRNNSLIDKNARASIKYRIKQKPYTCQVCRRKLSTLQSLHQHNMIHNNEKPFICPICRKDFRHLSNFKSHLQKHKDSREAYRFPHDKLKNARDIDFGRLVGPLFVKQSLLNKTPVKPTINHDNDENDENDVIPLKTFNSIDNIVLNATKLVVRVDHIDPNVIKHKIKTPDISIEQNSNTSALSYFSRKRKILFSPTADSSKRLKLDQIENIIIDDESPTELDEETEKINEDRDSDHDFDDVSCIVSNNDSIIKDVFSVDVKQQETLSDNELFELLNDEENDKVRCNSNVSVRKLSPVKVIPPTPDSLKSQSCVTSTVKSVNPDNEKSKLNVTLYSPLKNVVTTSSTAIIVSSPVIAVSKSSLTTSNSNVTSCSSKISTSKSNMIINNTKVTPPVKPSPTVPMKSSSVVPMKSSPIVPMKPKSLEIENKIKNFISPVKMANSSSETNKLEMYDAFDLAFYKVALRRLQLIKKKAMQNGGKVAEKYLLGPLFWQKALYRAKLNKTDEESEKSNLNDLKAKLECSIRNRGDLRRTNDPAKLQLRAENKLQYMLRRISNIDDRDLSINLSGPLFWRKTLRLAGVRNARDLKLYLNNESMSLHDVQFVKEEELPKEPQENNMSSNYLNSKKEEVSDIAASSSPASISIPSLSKNLKNELIQKEVCAKDNRKNDLKKTALLQQSSSSRQSSNDSTCLLIDDTSNGDNNKKKLVDNILNEDVLKTVKQTESQSATVIENTCTPAVQNLYMSTGENVCTPIPNHSSVPAAVNICPDITSCELMTKVTRTVQVDSKNKIITDAKKSDSILYDSLTKPKNRLTKIFNAEMSCTADKVSTISIDKKIEEKNNDSDSVKIELIEVSEQSAMDREDTTMHSSESKILLETTGSILVNKNRNLSKKITLKDAKKPDSKLSTRLTERYKLDVSRNIEESHEAVAKCMQIVEPEVKSGDKLIVNGDGNYEVIAQEGDKISENIEDGANYVLVSDGTGGMQLVKENDLQFVDANVEDNAEGIQLIVNMAEDYGNFGLVRDENGDTYALQFDGENYTAVQILPEEPETQDSKELVIKSDLEGAKIIADGENFVITSTGDISHIGKELSDFLNIDYDNLIKKETTE